MRIGLVGAFERDNFGDVLFLERTEALFRGIGHEPIPLSPFRQQSEQLRNEGIPAYRDAIGAGMVDAIWVVGGEVGGVSLKEGLRMTFSDEQLAQFDRAPRARRARLLTESSGLQPYELPYMPAMAAIRNLPIVVNSVGVSGIAQLRSPQLREALKTLRGARYVSVRDNKSSAVLNKVGISHRVAPDLVHTIREERESLVSHFPVDTPTAIIQFSAASVRGITPKSIARSLSNSRDLLGHQIAFFSAGRAPGHDAVDVYQAVADELLRIVPSADVRICDESSPLERAALIAGSRLVVGTSLHVMVLSIAFGIPHIGLMLRKLSRYGQTWGDSSPYGVEFESLHIAVRNSLTRYSVDGANLLGDRLSGEANENATRALAALSKESPVVIPRVGGDLARDRRLLGERSVKARVGLAAYRARNPLV